MGDDSQLCHRHDPNYYGEIHMKYKAVIYVKKHIDFDLEAEDAVDAYQKAVAQADSEIMGYEEYESWSIGEIYEMKLVQFSKDES